MGNPAAQEVCSHNARLLEAVSPVYTWACLLLVLLLHVFCAASSFYVEMHVGAHVYMMRAQTGLRQD